MKYKKNYNLSSVIYIIIPVLFILFILFIIGSSLNKISNFSYSENENFENNEKISYYRCKDKLIGKIMKNIFDKNNIENSNENWNLYIPCGYNNVESELKKILIDKDNKNKYIFGINGCDTIVSKNKIWESLLGCYGRKKASTLMPESYILGDPNEMEEFRKKYNPSKNEIYILKKNIQRKEGLKLTRDYFEIMEAVVDDYKVVQKYITDLYLINGRKINLRIYLLISMKDKTINFYLCKNGKCIYTNKKYNDNDLDFESNITSYHLDMNVYKENPRDFNELREYLNKDKDPKFFSEKNGDYLFNKTELLMREVSLCLYKNLFQSKNIEGTTTFQLFGVDVIFDKELNPYLLEMNKGPDMNARDDIDEKMKSLVQSDMFKTVGVLNGNIDENSFYLIYKNKIIEK